MLNITTFLDANSKRLDKKVLYNPKMVKNILLERFYQ